jgi:SprB repeat/HYR domain/Secretion system C-terminal sorting domain
MIFEVFKSRLFQTGFGAVLSVLLLGFSSNPPNGYTGAPFDGHCNACHGGDNRNGYAGQIEISGLPPVIAPNTTYTVTFTLRVTAGNPAQGGFQMVVVDGAQNNAGDLTPLSTETSAETAGNREYIEHSGAKPFYSDTVQWQFRWTSPAAAANNAIQLFYIGNFGNGGSTSGDFPLAAAQVLSFSANPQPLGAAVESADVSCFGGTNGRATARANGGTPPFRYVWSNGQTTQTATNLSAGTYTVTISDAENNTSASASATIAQPPVLELGATVSSSITCIQTSVEVAPQAKGGTGPYRFLWSNGQTGNPAVYTTGGSGSVTATDAKGCSKMQVFSIFFDTIKPLVKIASSSVLHCNNKAVQLDGTGSSEGQNMRYSWSSTGGNIGSGGTTLKPVVDAPGTYCLSIQNSTNGCLSKDSVVVRRLDPVVAIVKNKYDSSCPEAKDGSGSIAAQGGDGTYRFTWSHGVLSDLATQLGAGEYTVTVVDGAGCSDTAKVVIVSTDMQPPLLICPRDIVVFETDTVRYALPPASDNCNLFNAQVVLTGGLPSGRLFPLGVSTQTFTLFDASGNRGNCSFSVTVKPTTVRTTDPEAPVLRLRPNPANAVLYVDLTDFKVLNARIFNVLGGYVRTLGCDELQTGIDVSGLPGGAYYLSVTTTSGQIIVKQWIKQ